MGKYKPIPAVIAQRAHANVTVDPATGCWNSNYAKAPNGYAMISHKPHGEKSQGYLAHRASWTHANGAIPFGIVVDHMCFNRSCVNPDHLRLLTRADNSMRKTGDDFPLGQCKWGHPESSRIRVYWKSRSYRTECSECRKIVNDLQTQINSALGKLEYHYGIRLTRKQRAMVEEFMPPAYAVAA